MKEYSRQAAELGFKHNILEGFWKNGLRPIFGPWLIIRAKRAFTFGYGNIPKSLGMQKSGRRFSSIAMNWASAD